MKSVEFQKSVRMFRKFSEEALRRRGGNQLGREGVAALMAIEAVLGGERLFDGSLLEPLAAFTNLLQSSQLPPEFGAYSFGDALLAIEEAHAEQRQNTDQLWEFAGELDSASAAQLAAFTPPELASGPADSAHATECSRFVLAAARSAPRGRAVVSCALACDALPLAQLAEHFQKLVLSDLDLERLEALVRRSVPEPLRARIELERYDASGCYVAFAGGADQAVQSASSPGEAAQSLASLLKTYDVGAGSAGLTRAEGRADLAISALGLAGLGKGLASYVTQAYAARGWEAADALAENPLAPVLELLSRLLEQHHIQALLRRASGAVLLSGVSEVELALLDDGQSEALDEPRDSLGVEHLVERLPSAVQPKAERSWEWRQGATTDAADPEKLSLLTLVEAVLV
ncbi:MAG TPA: hypothetical protein VIW29_12570 [Polyangiaceae bacterium]